MRLQLCLAFALVAGAAMAQNGDWRHDDHRRITREEVRFDRNHDWVLEHGRYRYWARDHWIYETAPVVEPAFNLSVRIGDLRLQLSDLEHGPWFAGRDARCAELRAKIARCDR